MSGTGPDDDRMPHVELTQSGWSDEERASFLRKRRARNFWLLGALGLAALIIYVIALIKLHEYGQMW
jgi:hypothetical protein